MPFDFFFHRLQTSCRIRKKYLDILEMISNNEFRCHPKKKNKKNINCMS